MNNQSTYILDVIIKELIVIIISFLKTSIFSLAHCSVTVVMFQLTPPVLRASILNVEFC